MKSGNLRGQIFSTSTMSTHDGPGLRTVIFLFGCHCRCVYCHNPESWIGKGDFTDVDSLVEKCKRDQAYYGHDGGVTISGGEPLLQEAFTLALIEALKNEKIHVAIDTSGLVFSKDVLDAVDLVIMDIKGYSQESLNSICNGQWSEVKKNLDYIEKEKIPHIYRHVVVPGINGTTSSIKEIMALTKSPIDFLPYHTLGRERWKKLALEHPLPSTEGMKSATLSLLIKDAKNKEDPRE